MRLNCSFSTLGLQTHPNDWSSPGPEVIKLFSCSAQLSLKFILLINVGILTFISRINYCLMEFRREFSTDFGYFSIYEIF